MFNIKNYLEEIDCPNCSLNSYKIIKRSNYSEVTKLEDILKIYRSSGDDFLFDQMVKCKNCEFQYLNPRINSKIIFDSYKLNSDEIIRIDPYDNDIPYSWDRIDNKTE